MEFKLLIAFLLFGLGANAQVFQTNSQPYKFKGLKADTILIIPVGCDTPLTSNPKWGTASDGALFLKTCDTTLWAKMGQRYVQLTGTIAPVGVDSFYFNLRPLGDSTKWVFDRGDRVDTMDLTSAIVGDTTIFDPIIDSTGNPDYRVLFAKDNKITGSDTMRYNPTYGRLYVGPIGPHSTNDTNFVRLSIRGYAQAAAFTSIYGKYLGLSGRGLRIGDTINLTPVVTTPDTTQGKPVIQAANGNLLTLDKYPVVNDPTKPHRDSVILNQNATDQSANFRISGSGQVNNGLIANNGLAGVYSKSLPAGNTFNVQHFQPVFTADGGLRNRLDVVYNDDGFNTLIESYSKSVTNNKNSGSITGGLSIINGSRYFSNGTVPTGVMFNQFNIGGTSAATIPFAVAYGTTTGPYSPTPFTIDYYTVFEADRNPPSVNNARGLYVGPSLVGTNFARAIDLDVTSGSGKYNVYAGGSAPNYFAGSVGIGAANVNASASFQIDNSAKGFLLNRGTTINQNAIPLPATLLHYVNSDSGVLTRYNGSAWHKYLTSQTRININGVEQNLSSPVVSYRAGLSNTGALTYAGATVATTTTINVSAVTGIISDNETTPGTPTYTVVNYAGQSGVAVPTIGSGLATYVLLDKGTVTNGIGAGQLVFQNTFPTTAQRKAMIYLSKISHPNSSTISFVLNEVDFVTSPLQQFRDLFQVFNYLNDGITISGNAGLTINSTAGTILGNGINFATDRTKPNNIDVTPGTPRNFVLLNQTGPGSGSFQTAIDPTTYDNAGTTTTIGGGTNNSTIQYLFYVPGVGFAIQRGQTVYSTLSDAVSAVGREAFTIRANFVRNSIAIAAICMRHTATNMNDLSFVRIVSADKLGQLIGGSAGIPVSTLQSAYNNSVIPQITTSVANGAVAIRRGSTADTDSVIVVQNGAGTGTFKVDGNGKATATSFTSTSTTAGFVPNIVNTTQMNAISSPVAGTVVYNTDSIALCSYTGSAWRKYSVGSGGVSAIGTLNSVTKSANGANVSGSNLVMQTVGPASPGILSTGTDTIAGAKIFTGGITSGTVTLGTNGYSVSSDNSFSTLMVVPTGKRIDMHAGTYMGGPGNIASFETAGITFGAPIGGRFSSFTSNPSGTMNSEITNGTGTAQNGIAFTNGVGLQFKAGTNVPYYNRFEFYAHTSGYLAVMNQYGLKVFGSTPGVPNNFAANAALHVESTTQGSIPAPVMSTTQWGAVPKEIGLQAYDNVKKMPIVYDGTSSTYITTVTTGTAAPATTPTGIGMIFIDTTNKKAYISTGTASSADWTILN